MAELAGWRLVAATVAGYGLVGQLLYRSGCANARLTGVIPLLAGAATLVYGSLAAWFGLRSPDSTLALTVTAFILGSVAFAVLTALPILARQERVAAALVAYGRYLILGYAQRLVVLVGFLLLSVLGLA